MTNSTNPEAITVLRSANRRWLIVEGSRDEGDCGAMGKRPPRPSDCSGNMAERAIEWPPSTPPPSGKLSLSLPDATAVGCSSSRNATYCCGVDPHMWGCLDRGLPFLGLKENLDGGG
jgi:hypothetical protein